MFTNQTAKALHLVFGAAVTGAILTATPAHAADPVERTPSTMNQASVYESTLKFYCTRLVSNSAASPRASGWIIPRSSWHAGHPPVTTGPRRSFFIRRASPLHPRRRTR